MASKVAGLHPLPKHHWESRYNQRKFFDSIKEPLKLKDFEDWYKVKNTDVVKLGGKAILEHYGNSLCKALTAVYPEREWVSWKFHKIPRGYWLCCFISSSNFITGTIFIINENTLTG